MAYELPPLPYDYAALEPVIDKQTMTIHHDLHHGAYVRNLNAAIEKHPELASKSAEDLIRDLSAPAGLPPGLKTKLAAACQAAAHSDIYAKLARSVFQPSDYYADGAAFAANLEKDVADKGRLLKGLGELK